MPRLLPSLSFDSSGSAVCRIFSRPLKYRLHYPVGLKLSADKCGCPNDLYTENDPAKKACLACERDYNNPNIKTYDRYAMIGWDCKKKKWCIVYAGEPLIMALLEQCKNNAVSSEALFNGKGPDFAILRQGIQQSAEALMTTISIDRSVGTSGWDFKVQESELAGEIAKRSHWAEMDYASLVRMYVPRQEEDLAYESAAPIDRGSQTSVNILPIFRVVRRAPLLSIYPPQTAAELRQTLERLENQAKKPVNPQVKQPPPKERLQLDTNEDFWDNL